MQIRKMLAAFISVVMMCSVVSVPAFAVDETQIVTDLVSPAYEYAMKTENYITITSSNADCKSLCEGMAGVTQITVEHTLEKHWGLWIWSEVDGASWTSVLIFWQQQTSQHYALQQSLHRRHLLHPLRQT